MSRRTPFTNGFPKRNRQVSDMMIQSMFDENGNLTPTATRLLAKGEQRRTPSENALVREVVLFIWARLPQKQVKILAEKLGVKPITATQLLKRAFAPLERDEAGRELLISDEMKLEALRFESQAKMIKDLYDYATRALVRGAEQIPQMTPNEARMFYKECMEKALLLSGEATSRSSRMNERNKSTEDLRAEAEELDKKLQSMEGLKLVGE